MSAEPAKAAEVPVSSEPDRLPVLHEVRAVAPAPAGPTPVGQAAALAATGLVAGAATVALARRRSARKALPSRRRRKGGKGDAVQVLASRSFLVDVHLVDRG